MQKHSSSTIRAKIAAKRIASFGESERIRAVQKIPQSMITTQLLKRLEEDLKGINRKKVALTITRAYFKPKSKEMQIVAEQILKKIKKEQPQLYDEVTGEVAIEALENL